MTFNYEITWWNEFEGENGQFENSKGFIVAKNYLDATKKLIHSFGERETECFYLEAFSPDDFIDFRKNKTALADYVKKELKEDIMW